MSAHTTPESQILDCMQQLQEKRDTTYGEHVQQLAYLRLADFSSLLAEWRVPSQLPQGEPMPQVAQALTQPEKLNAEQGAKLVAYLQQNAKQSNKTAILYLAYLFAKGLFVPQSPERAAAFTRKLMQEGDWRGTRFWAEMLTAAPPVAPIWLKAEVEPAARQWQAAHTQLSADEVQANIHRFYAADAARRFAAKRAFELAVKQGSPTAAKRLRGLTVLGELPVSQPARQFQSIANWLDMQIMAQNQAIPGDDEVFVLPENVPLLAQDGDEEQAQWIKPAVYACIVVIFALLSVLLFRIVAK